ncbi:MAG TPA: glycosyl transferase family protein [Bacteroidota bacterium]|nr:glycosyl transferase family protein [Bacteroidota bacterium]
MLGWFIEFFRSSYHALYIATFLVAAFLFVSGLDDIFIDLYYWLHYLLNRKKFIRYAYESPQKLHEVPEKPIAIFIPAWREQNVIDKMLVNACRTIQYRNYDIFVGVYPNDPETTMKVEEIGKLFPNIHAVISANDGPTTKADNLNQIHSGMLRWENRAGVRYDIIVMHDAEDVIHPMSLKIQNYLIPTHDMVQMPVFPLHMSHFNLVHWTYADEFAEYHTKDLHVRQLFSGFVPSAGVGTAFNRWLIEFVGTSFAKNIFRSKSLTEDYDLAMRLALGRANLLFVYKPFGINCATRSFFPDTMGASIRQKSRWVTGICLQSWRLLGWKGDAKFRFVLYRDRKAVMTNAINFFAYLVIGYFIAYEAIRFGFATSSQLPPIVVKGTMLFDLVVLDSSLMLWRILHRFITVRRVYGLWAAVLSIVRLPISNIVNFSATGRALFMFYKAMARKRELRWEKTSNRFPSAVEQTIR